MTPEEQGAFVKAYGSNVSHHPDEYVAKFVACYMANMDIDYSYEHTSIMDSLGIWHDAIKWQLEQKRNGLI